MLQLNLWSFLFIVLPSCCYVIGHQKVLFCYISSWAAYRPNEGKFTIDDVDPNLCTHLVYSYLGINETTNKIMSRDKYLDFKVKGIGLGQFEQFVKLKDSNPNLKLLGSVGGWDEGSGKFSNMVISTAKRTTFVDSVVDFLSQYNLDGIDISWQFPTDRGGIPEDKTNFVSLLKELRDKLKQNNKILSVQLHCKRYIVDPGYDLKAISYKVDFINMMTYEFNGQWDGVTGFNAPIVSDNELNVLFAIDYFIKKRASPEKLLLGISTFGHNFIMKKVPKDGIYLNVPTDGGYITQWTRSKGRSGYNEICYELSTTIGWKELWDNKSKTPYAVNHNKFLSYDDPQSILEKMKLVNLKGLAGVTVTSLDTDDFKGLCNDTKFPLVTTIKNFLAKGPSLITNLGVSSHNYGH